MVWLQGKSVHATELFRNLAISSVGRRPTRITSGSPLDVIRSTVPIGIAVGFDARHCQSLASRHQKHLGRPLVVCMSRGLDLAVNVVTEMRDRGDNVFGINLIFDDSEKDAVDMLSARIQLKKARKELRSYVRSVGFADDTAFYPSKPQIYLPI
jgi:hypothetical protein